MYIASCSPNFSRMQGKESQCGILYLILLYDRYYETAGRLSELCPPVLHKRLVLGPRVTRRDYPQSLHIGKIHP
jgi:hypothetical protein